MVFAVLILWQHSLAERNAKTLGVDFLDTLHDLKQSGAAGDTVGFQGGRYRQADGFLCTRRIRHDKIGRQRVELPVGQFD